jgi:predicted type IV restriction endonuclease
MTFKEQLLKLSEKVESHKNETGIIEQPTKNVFINPFIEILGYKVSDLADVTTELLAAFSSRNNHRVDYGLKKNGEVIILVECKKFKEKLGTHGHQLSNYFQHHPNARFGILTNGYTYRFYTDLNIKNTMDAEPFFEFNLTELNDETIELIKRFSKEKFNEKELIEQAEELSYSNDVWKVLKEEITKPSKEFIKFIADKARQDKKRGNLTEKKIQLFDKIVNRNLQMVLSQITVTPPPDSEDEVVSKIVTTDQEIEAFHIVKSILRQHVAADRIDYKDSQTYFSVRMDNSSHKTICRFYLSSGKKYIGIFDKSRKEQKSEIQSIDDTFNFIPQLVEAASIHI